MIDEHESESLGVYVLDVLDEREKERVDQHLASCDACRAELGELIELRDLLGEVPPELFLDGPPEDGELMLRRTLRKVRGTPATSRRTRFTQIAAAAAVLAAVALGGGVVLGRQTGTTAVALPPPAPVTATPVPGTKVISGGEDGARLTATVVPAAGWVRVNVSATGIAAGRRCRLVVVSKSGRTEVAGSWLVSPQAAVKGTNVDGAALIAPEEVAAVQVRDFAGQTLVTAPA